PYYIELVYEACLKSFWRKKALSKFLRLCGVSGNFIATWGPDESKRDFLDRLFIELPKSDSGLQGLLRIAAAIMDQKTFPDLQNWEDSADKIKAAHEAVLRLKLYHDKQEEGIQTEEERQKARAEFQRKQAEVARSQHSLQKLDDRLNELGKRLGDQQAGYDFQTWFYDLLDFSEIQNRRPYMHGGRQIDGSLTLSGTTYLAELKFTTSPTDPVAIGDFFKKVIDKADNTMGVFVSISGYTDVAKKEASSAKTPLLLLDHNHLYLVLGGIMSMSDVIERIRRHASQTGEAYLAAKDFTG
ncbi:MAG: restriction endonuclease, partial [Candidatus Krumholzibacteriaceae bacterium]